MKNHLGEQAQSTFAGWKAAMKRIAKGENSTLIINGNKDIAEAFGDTRAIGHWNGEQGCTYKQTT